MGNWRIDAKLERAWFGGRPGIAATGREDSPDRFLERTDAVISVDGWAAGAVWIEAWACRGGWIVLDHSAHLDVCRGMESDTWQVLWYERIDADDVWAMLAELRSRSEAQEILVVRRVADRVAFESPGFASLRALCCDYRATLLVVIQQP